MVCTGVPQTEQLRLSSFSGRARVSMCIHTWMSTATPIPIHMHRESMKRHAATGTMKGSAEAITGTDAAATTLQGIMMGAVQEPVMQRSTTDVVQQMYMCLHKTRIQWRTICSSFHRHFLLQM